MSESLPRADIPPEAGEIPVESDVALVTASGERFLPLDEQWPAKKKHLESIIVRGQESQRQLQDSLGAKDEEIRAKHEEFSRELEAREGHFSAEIRAREEELEAKEQSVRDAAHRQRGAQEEAAFLRTTVLQDLKQRMQDLEGRLAASEAARELAEDKLDQVVRSSSWRLTAPIRATLDLVRGRRPPSAESTDPESPDPESTAPESTAPESTAPASPSDESAQNGQP